MMYEEAQRAARAITSGAAVQRRTLFNDIELLSKMGEKLVEIHNLTDIIARELRAQDDNRVSSHPPAEPMPGGDAPVVAQLSYHAHNIGEAIISLHYKLEAIQQALR